MGGVVLHDAGEPEVGQLAGVAALVVVGHRARLQQHVGALQIRLHARRVLRDTCVHLLMRLQPLPKLFRSSQLLPSSRHAERLRSARQLPSQPLMHTNPLWQGPLEGTAKACGRTGLWT